MGVGAAFVAEKDRCLVQVLTGNGKGKTSAALGAAVRAAGHGLRVYIVFFMKGNYPYGEFTTLARLPNVESIGFGFSCLTNPADVRQEEIDQARQAMDAARKAILGGKYDLVVLDEINVAAAWKLIEVEDIIKLIQDKPGNVELILTGRYADPRVIELADLVTEMVNIKHPYDKGVLARKGIEY